MKKLLVCGLVVWMGAVGATESTPAAETPVAKEETPAVVTVIDDRYEILNGGTEIRDLQTTLIWQRCSVGQTWGGTRCEGSASSWREMSTRSAITAEAVGSEPAPLP